MRKYLWIVALVTLIACLAVFVGCSVTTESYDSTTSEAGEQQTSSVTEIDPVSDESIPDVAESTENFSIVTEDGSYTEEGSVYTLTAAGTYTLSGLLEGQIVVNAGEDDKVTIELAGVTIKCATDSPIKVTQADKVEISAKKETENLIKDTRSEQTTDSDEQGKGAIAASCDLEIKGKGVLAVEAGYNNGIHTSDDLTIKNLTLKVTAVNNALKGKDSVSIESGTIVAISTKGDGIKTESSDLSSKGNQRGTVTIAGEAAVAIYAAGDGIQASYNFEMEGGSLTIYTGSYSSYTASGASTTSYKGVKVGNELLVKGGSIKIHSYDDGLHADYGTTLENGNKGVGNITISGGTITIGVYSPEKSTPMGGGKVRGGWGAQQSVKGSDAIHADNTLTVSGGNITVDSAYEGLEATHIVIDGGETKVFATDDGVNAAKKVSNSPSVTVTGGYLQVTVPTNGDTDGIDSNGTYVQSGGVVVTCGPGSASGGMGGGAWALDADGSISLQGGTLIIFGGMEKTPSGSGMTKTICATNNVSAGSHTVTVGGTEYTISLTYATNGCVVYSSAGNASLK